VNEVCFYDDTERRMRDDAEFSATVQMLMAHAMRHGFTPGELRQIAFRAAFELEMRSAHRFGREGELAEQRALMRERVRRG
jgi:hypothetical protein